MESNHEILGFAVPTNEPDVAFNYLLSSIENLREVAPISTFLFNFQKPWTEDQISKAVKICEDNGFAVRYTFNTYEIKGKGLIPFNQIRGDACKLMPNAKFYVLMDDDFSFLPRSGSYNKSAGELYLDLIYYMTKHPDCGFILLKGRLYLNEVPKYQIAPALSLDNRYITDKGILLRNFKPEEGLALPNSALGLLGSDEEKIACSWRLFNGMYPAVINRCRTLHYENCNTTKVENKPVSGEDMYGWNKKDILDANVNKYIKEHFYADFKNGAWRITQLVDHQHYLEVGGCDVTDPEVRASRTMMTDTMFSSDLMDEIINYYS